MSPEVAEFLGLLAPDGAYEGLLWKQLKSRKTIPATPEDATHFCIARLGSRRVLAAHRPGMHLCICIDDVGTKRNRPPVAPSLKVETHPGNELWVYLLEDPEATLEAVAALLHALNHDGAFGDPNSYGANALFRLPGGRRPPGKAHDARLLPSPLDDVRVWTVDGLYRDFACEGTIAAQVAARAERLAALRAEEPGDHLPEAEALLPLISPDLPRDPSSGWMRVIMALHFEGRGGAAALALAHRWSSGARVKAYDPADLDYQWASLDGREVATPVRIGAIRHLAREADRERAEAIIAEHERLRQAPDIEEVAAFQRALRAAGAAMDEPAEGRSDRPSDAIMPELLERLVLTPKGVIDLEAEPLTVVGLDVMAMLFNAHDDPPPGRGHVRVSAVKTRWVQRIDKQYSVEPPHILPRRPFGFIAERQETSHVAGKINSYRPRRMVSDGPQPGDEGCVEAFLRHMAWTYPGEGDADYALDWFAYKLQHPWQRMTALCNVTAQQGTGRTSAAALLGMVLGRGNSIVMSIQALFEDKYNGYLKRPLLIINEAENLPQEGSGHRAGRSMIDRLNDIIDPGGGEVSIREMNTDHYSTLSPMAPIINSNRPAALQLPDQDRRFDFSHGNDRRMPDKLAAWIQRVIRPGAPDEAALDAVQRYLLARDVAAFRYWDVRRNAAKAVMISEARTGIEVAVDSALEAIGQPVVITTALLAEVLRSQAMQKADREAYAMARDMGDRLGFALRAWAKDHTHVPECLGGVVEVKIEGEKHRPRERNGQSRYRDPERRKAMVEALTEFRDKVDESLSTGVIHPFVVLRGGRSEQSPDDQRDD